MPLNLKNNNKYMYVLQLKHSMKEAKFPSQTFDG